MHRLSTEITLISSSEALELCLTENARNQISIVEEGGFESLIRLSQVQDEMVQADIARAYANITSNGENQVGVFKPDVLQSLFLLCTSVEEKCGKYAAMAVGNLAVVSANQEEIAREGGIKPLVALLSSEYLSVAHYAARALYRLAANKQNQIRIANENAIFPLIQLAGSSDETVSAALQWRCAISAPTWKIWQPSCGRVPWFHLLKCSTVAIETLKSTVQ